MTLYIVYFWTKGTASGYGQCDYTISTNKLGIRDISNIRREIIEKERFDNLVILNWKEMGF